MTVATEATVDDTNTVDSTAVVIVLGGGGVKLVETAVVVTTLLVRIVALVVRVETEADSVTRDIELEVGDKVIVLFGADALDEASLDETNVMTELVAGAELVVGADAGAGAPRGGQDSS